MRLGKYTTPARRIFIKCFVYEKGILPTPPNALYSIIQHGALLSLFVHLWIYMATYEVSVFPVPSLD